jgi:hypothetical protein
MLAHAAPTRNAWRLGGFLVMCLVIGCQCPTTPPVAAEGLQSMQRALEMGAAGGRGAPDVCFRGVGTESQAPYDACLVAAPDSVCGGGRWCAAVPAAMVGRTKGAKWVGPLHLPAHKHNDRVTTVVVLDTASWGLHFTWACEDDGRARQGPHCHSGAY